MNENDKKQRAVEEMVAFLEKQHRQRIRDKIILSNDEMDREACEFLGRLTAATYKRARELGANR